MATGPLSIKLRCASWQQLSTIYKRDLSRGTMFLKAAQPPPVGTQVRIDLTLPSASVIVLSGVVDQHVTDPQRGAGVELKLAPIPAGSVWMIESALASESKRRNTPVAGVPVAGGVVPTSGGAVVGVPSGPIPSISESEDVVAAEQDLVKALLSEAESLKKLNPFLVLGVGYEATDGDVRAAFGELTKRYHPDLFARYESTELRAVAAEIFILIRDAYRKLGDEASRTQVLTSLGRPTAPRAVPIQNRPPPVPVKPPRAPTGQVPILPPPPQARPFTDVAQTTRPGEGAVPPIPGRGLNTPARGIPAVTTPLPPPKPGTTSPPKPPSVRESQAIPTLPTSGVKRAPTEPPPPPVRNTPPRPETAPPPPLQTNRSPVGNAPPVLSGEAGENALEDLLDAGKFDEALAAYKVMAKKNPADRTYRAGIELCEGLRALNQRDRLEAAQRFEAALEIDPSNERAARELAEMRRLATNERKGLLTRLMGKKDP